MKIIRVKIRIYSLLRPALSLPLAFPLTAFAQDQNITSVEGLLGRMQLLLDKVVPFIIGLAVFVVIWGILTYISHAGEEEKRGEAKKFILWGIIGIFFMLSIWGFVNILLKTFSLERNINPNNIPHVPQISDGGTGGPCTDNKRSDGTAC